MDRRQNLAGQLKTPRVAVIGGGYAGMAAAVELASAHTAVTVFEASRTLGGRARAIEFEDQGQHLVVDNGQHILVGAYRETLRLMTAVGAAPAQKLMRLPLSIEFPGQMHLTAPQLPAPLHLLCGLLSARGIDAGEKWQAIRFMQWLKRRRFLLTEDMPVVDLLDRQNQSARLQQYLWQPLCTAALNTLAERASAQIFCTVLRDTLGADRGASDFLLPLVDLSQMFPEPAADYISRHGGDIRRNLRVRHIRREAAAWWLDDNGPYDHVVLAVGPYHLASLIEGIRELDPLRTQISQLEWEPIVTAYLAYPETARLPCPLIAFADPPLQWLFDRGQCGGKAGLMAAVISARGPHLDLDHNELLARIREEIAAVLGTSSGHLGQPHWQRVIVEKRATFSCRPNLSRPAGRTSLDSLWLAGDYVASDYPATIEGAVRSGINAARGILAASGAAEK